jgi:hypothetical protein
MSSAKRDKSKSVIRPHDGMLARLFAVSRRRVLFVALCIGAVGGGYALWRVVGRDVVSSPHYVVALENVTITAPPGWVRSDIRDEVLRRSGSFDGPLSILDDGLAERVHKAFELHPWVAKVVRVTKRAPAAIDVELVYRRPACMVDVPGGVQPVDAMGVLLPRNDVSVNDARRYPRLSGIVTTPTAVGSPWGDLQVAAGAELAALLQDHWSKLNLHHIAVIANSAGGFTFEIHALPTNDGQPGTRIFWGHPIGMTAPGEASPAEKLALLLQFAKDHGAFKNPDAPATLDLRLAPAVTAAPRMARQPEDGTPNELH